MLKETPRGNFTADELINQIARYPYTRFQKKNRGKWYYVKQISKKEYERA